MHYLKLLAGILVTVPFVCSLIMIWIKVYKTLPNPSIPKREDVKSLSPLSPLSVYTEKILFPKYGYKARLEMNKDKNIKIIHPIGGRQNWLMGKTQETYEEK